MKYIYSLLFLAGIVFSSIAQDHQLPPPMVRSEMEHQLEGTWKIYPFTLPERIYLSYEDVLLEDLIYFGSPMLNAIIQSDHTIIFRRSIDALGEDETATWILQEQDDYFRPFRIQYTAGEGFNEESWERLMIFIEDGIFMELAVQENFEDPEGLPLLYSTLWIR